MLVEDIEEYDVLIEAYQQGLYTDAEVVSKSISMLFQSNNRHELWKHLSSGHRILITQLLTDFDESAEPFSINSDPFRVWSEMSALKRWVLSK